MEIDPEQRRALETGGQRISRALVHTLVIGAIAFLALVMWFLQMGGGMWR